MDISNKPSRSQLKKFFVKNAIPTESNFADLIEAGLNQRDDGIAKLPGDPLSIEATGDATSLRKLVNFYQNLADANPEWLFSLNPRGNPADPAAARSGFSIGDGQGNSRLFIDKATGNLGVGSIAPVAKLDVAQAPRTGTHPAAVKGLYVTGDFGADQDGVEFRHTNGTQGIGFGFNTIYATGSNKDQDLFVTPRGAGNLALTNGKFLIGKGSPATARLNIDQGRLNDPALLLTSSGPGWGSGMVFENTTPGKGQGWGIYSDEVGKFVFHDNARAKGLLILENGLATVVGRLIIRSAKGQWEFQDDGNVCFRNARTGKLWCFNSSLKPFEDVRAE